MRCIFQYGLQTVDTELLAGFGASGLECAVSVEDNRVSLFQIASSPDGW
jgi:hypothetical protein